MIKEVGYNSDEVTTLITMLLQLLRDEGMYGKLIAEGIWGDPDKEEFRRHFWDILEGTEQFNLLIMHYPNYLYNTWEPVLGRWDAMLKGYKLIRK